MMPLSSAGRCISIRSVPFRVFRVVKIILRDWTLPRSLMSPRYPQSPECVSDSPSESCLRRPSMLIAKQFFIVLDSGNNIKATNFFHKINKLR